MKRFAFLFVAVIAVVSCRQGNVVDKPEKLIAEDQMVNMLYDLTVMQTIYSVSSYDLGNKRIDGYAYLKSKYGIDSTSFAKNHKYYAAQPEKYQKMQQQITEKIEQEKLKLTKAKPATQGEKLLEENRSKR